MPTYNGHKNWNHWNVSLWINNDEGLYRLAQDCVKYGHNRSHAAALFLERLEDILGDNLKTPDGAPYTLTNVIAAMRGIEK